MSVMGGDMKAVAVCALCLTACSSGRGDAERTTVPAIAFPTVLPSPVDLSTGVGRDARPHLDVTHDGLPVGPSLETLAAQVSLKTWPEFAPVLSSIATQDANSTPVAASARIEVIPSVPLEDRWYALVIDTVPPRFELPSGQPRVSLGGNAFVSRFKTASAPFVVSVRLCDDTDTAQTTVVLALSELVLCSAETVAGAVTISQPGNPDLRCTVQGFAAPVMSGRLSYACAGMDPATPLSISVVPSLASATGKPIASFSATLLRRDLIDDAGSCRILRPWSAASAPLP